MIITERKGDEAIIWLIGNKEAEINIIKSQINLPNITILWNYLEIIDNNVDDCFNKLIIDYEKAIEEENMLSQKNLFNFAIIYYLNSKNKEELNNLSLLFKKIIKSDNYSPYFEPFFILLDTNEEENYLKDRVNELDVKIDKKYNISYFNYSFNDSSIIKEENIKSINKKLLTIYSYFYQLGDENFYQRTEKELYNINIILSGRSQVGKSTLINILLKEKKAREGGNNTNVSKKILAYHVDNFPRNK